MKAGTGFCNDEDSFYSGKKAGEDAIKSGRINRPDLVFAFCSGSLDHQKFFSGLQSVVGKGVPIIGGSTIGIITNENLSYKGYPSGAAILQSDNFRLIIDSAGDLNMDEKTAGMNLAAKLKKKLQEESEALNNCMIIFYDSVKSPGNLTTPPVLNASSPLIAGIEQKLGHGVNIFGAGLIGEFDLGQTKQFCGSCVATQNLVGAIFAGDFKHYFRIMHGCTPLDGVYHTITKIKGSAIYELDGKPIVEIIDNLYGNKNWRNQNPVDLLTIGVNHGKRYEETLESNYVNRLITGVLPEEEGIGIFEPDLWAGTEIQFMLRDGEKMIESARRNSEELMQQIFDKGEKPCFGLYINCAGRAAEYSKTFTEEASEVQKVFNKYDTPLFGFYSGVEVAPFLQKSRGLDWTGVLLVFAV